MAYLDPIKEAQAVKALLESLAAMGEGDDEDLAGDMIEGQTSFAEVVDRIVERMAFAEAAIDGLDAMKKRLDGRKVRFEKRIVADRALLEQALTIAGLPNLERPTATLVLSARAPSLMILEESAIPSAWFKVGDPVLDKKGLLAALRTRAKALADIPGPDEPEARAAALAVLPDEIPGVALSNGAPSLTIRRA
jgi:Siphovirus Gp157